MVELSVIVPVRDEEENLEELVSRLTRTLEGLDLPLGHELVFVTDLNRDNTFYVLKNLHDRDHRIKVIKLSNTFGHHVAVVAGLRHCSGRYAVIMDGDLQDYPEDIPKLFGKLKQGFDVVYGTKRRKNDSALRNMLSKVFVGALRRIADYDLDYNTSMFRIMTRRMVDELLKFKERDQSLTALVSLIGFPTAKVEVHSGKRLRGKTKYTLSHQFNFALSFLVSFSIKPLRIMSILGFILAGFSLSYLVLVLVQKLIFGMGILGWPTIISLMTLFGGIQLFTMGLLGEYIGRIFLETKERPLYIVETKIGDLP